MVSAVGKLVLEDTGVTPLESGVSMSLGLTGGPRSTVGEDRPREWTCPLTCTHEGVSGWEPNKNEPFALTLPLVEEVSLALPFICPGAAVPMPL